MKTQLTSPRVTAEPASAAERAKVLRSSLMSLGKQLFNVDDSALDLPLRQFKVCMALHERPGTMSEVSREIGVSLSAMTQLADRLERAGLVERVFQGTDRRTRFLQLTSAGQRLMRVREEAQLRRMAECLSRLSDKRARQVLLAIQVLVRTATLKINGNE